MNGENVKALIKQTNFRNYADDVFDSPANTLEMIKRIAEDCAFCIEYQARLYNCGCFKSPELLKEFEKATTDIGLYKTILAELPKYL